MQYSLTKKKLVSWYTVLVVMKSIQKTLSNDRFAKIDAELNPLRLDKFDNRPMDNMVRIGLNQLGMTTQNTLGLNEERKWVGQDPCVDTAKLLFSFVFGKVDIGTSFMQQRSKYAGQYRIQERRPEAVDKLHALLRTMAYEMSQSGFNTREFCEKHKITGNVHAAMKWLKIVDEKFMKWIHPAFPNEEMAADILEVSSAFQREYVAGRKAEDAAEQKAMVTATVSQPSVKKSNRLLGMTIGSNPDTTVGKVWKAICDSNMRTGITATELIKMLPHDIQATTIGVSLNDLRRAGRLVNTSRGMYAVANTEVLSVQRGPNEPMVSYKDIKPEVIGNDMIAELKKQREEIDNKIKLAEEIRILEEQELELKRQKMLKQKNLALLMSA